MAIGTPSHAVVHLVNLLALDMRIERIDTYQ